MSWHAAAQRADTKRQLLRKWIWPGGSSTGWSPRRAWFERPFFKTGCAAKKETRKLAGIERQHDLALGLERSYKSLELDFEIYPYAMKENQSSTRPSLSPNKLVDSVLRTSAPLTSALYVGGLKVREGWLAEAVEPHGSAAVFYLSFARVLPARNRLGTERSENQTRTPVPVSRHAKLWKAKLTRISGQVEFSAVPV